MATKVQMLTLNSEGLPSVLFDTTGEGCVVTLGSQPGLGIWGDWSDTDVFSMDKQFIRIERDFKRQLERHFSPGDLDYNVAKAKLGESLSALLQLFPDVISMEVTHEKSIFYTVKKNGYTFFLQHFLEMEEDGDEAILTGFKDRTKLPSYAGLLRDCISELSYHITLPANTTKFDWQLHEVPA